MNAASLPQLDERYVAERALGEQPAGDFYVAVDTVLGGRVTVFEPRLRGVAPAEFVERLREELRRCEPLLDTPYCTLRDAGLTGEGRAYVVVDRPQGTPIAAQVREEGRFSIDRALSIAIQLCDLVRRAHGAGIRPVPVTPDNLVTHPLSGGRHRLSLVDLAMHRGAYRGAVHVPPRQTRWEAPQVAGGESPDVRDEVFAIAALVHFMVFGVAPPCMAHHGPADGSGWPLLPEDERGLDRRLEACLHTLLLKGLAPERAERFHSVEALQRSLTGLRQLLSLSAPAFELMAATRGRLGRRSDPLDLAVQRPALEKAAKARAKIREVVRSAKGKGASMSEIEKGSSTEPMPDMSLQSPPRLSVVNGRWNR